ncbi:hypothetical protein VTN49DRAFT_4861 [Thermomyces lanuginosus]|uniref:uncharacterized protein n=1 Tax=Thermomyces lanuginosus TaxID=5541 RepID=UPI0037449CFC
MTNFEKSVKGATKVKLAPPKAKYIEHILLATHSGEAGVAEIFRTLQFRLRDSTWTIVFKALIVLHLMIREGAPNATLEFLAANPRLIAISSFSEVQTQGQNIRRYADYFTARIKGFRDTHVDYVRNGPGRLKRLTVDKGLLRETEAVQKQIKALVRCNLVTDEVENEITLCAFRLLTLDLLTLYSVMNEGTINVLEHYFEMSRPDSERALNIYKTFTSLTDEVVKFLGVARHFEYATRLEIPNLKHASTDLAQLLEDDLNDPDFELRRREYRIQKEAKARKAAGKGGDSSTPAKSSNNASKPAETTKASESSAPKAETKKPTEDLIDFFESIEQNQQPLAPQPQQPPQQQPNFSQPNFAQPMFQPQPTGFVSQPTGFPAQTGFAPQQTGFGGPFGQQQPQQGAFPFGQSQPQPQPLQATPTGAGFGGYGPQSYTFQNTLSPVQNGSSPFQPSATPANGLSVPQQSTNPFRQSMLLPNTTGFGQNQTAPARPLSRQSTNPFAKRLSAIPQRPATATIGESMSQNQSAAPLQPQRTGTNPFARNTQPAQQPATTASTGLQPLRPNPTGSTNPFRQSAFINQQTGQGWHVSGQQGTMGGLEQLETVPVFPRPGMTS